MKNVVILGGSGYLGSALIKKMMKKWKITVIDNLAYGKEKWEWYPEVTFVEESIRCLGCIHAYLHEADIIINFACIHLLDSKANPILDLDINVKSVLFLLEFIKNENYSDNPENSDKGYIHISSGSIYQVRQYHSAPSHYALSKYMGELYTQLYIKNGLKAAIVRPFNVYGPGVRYRDGVVDKFLKQALEKAPYTIHRPGIQTITPTYVNDVVDIITEIVKQEAWGATYDAVGNESFTIGAVADLIDEVLGRKNERVLEDFPQVYGDSEIVVYPYMIEQKLNFYQPHSLKTRLQQMVDRK